MAKKRTDQHERLDRRITLRDLHILSFVVRSGSMAKAALQLSTSQSVVSVAVANLEAALGVRLVERSARGIEPTIYATTLLKRSRIAFDELHQAIMDIDRLDDSATGEIPVACSEFLSGGFISDVINGFTDRYPRFGCRVTDADARSVEFHQLQERTIDVTVARIPAAFSGGNFVSEILFDDPHVVVAGAGHPLASRPNVTLADLTAQDWILLASLVVREVLEEALGTKGFGVPNGRIISSCVLMRNHPLATGRFVTVLPASVLQYNASQWALRALPIKLQTTPRPIAAILLKDRGISPPVQLFLEYLRQCAAAHRTGAKE
jgi:DNA-binding transcriptional LysR family regulator